MPGNVLLIGSEMNSTAQAYLALNGVTSTIINGSDLSTTDLSAYSAIWIGWFTNVSDPTGTLAARLAAFVSGGGNLLVEPFTNVAQYLPSGSDVTTSYANGDDVHIVDSSGGLLSGLTDADLSNWYSAYHDSYNLADNDQFHVVAENTAGQDITLVQNYGSGHIVLTGQDPSYHLNYGSWHGAATGADSPEIAFVLNVLGLSNSSFFVNFDATSNYDYPSAYSEDGLNFSSPTHLHFENDMDGDGHNELGGHNYGTETIEITKTGGGAFSLIGMDTAAGPNGQNGPVEWIAYRLVNGVYVETGRMVITPGAHVTFTSAFQNIDRIVWNSGYSANGGMAVDNIEYRAGGTSPNVAPAAPTDVDATGDGLGIAASIAENHAVGTVIGLTAYATDADGDTLAYSFGSDADGHPVLASGPFTIDAATGVVTLASALDFETASGYALTIVATDHDGLSNSSLFNVSVTNVAPSAPVDTNGASGATVAESLAVGSAIGITASSTDFGGSPVTYSFHDGSGVAVQTAGNFTIDAVTGVVTLSSDLDYETATSHVLTVYASDGTASSASNFTVDVTNVAPGAPVDSDALANTLAENAAANTYTGVTALATDIHGGSVTYSLSNSAGGRFTVDAATGKIYASGSGNLDYETALIDAGGHYYEVQVRAFDGTDYSAATTMKIYVTNVVEHLFTAANDGTASAPINFNTLPDGAYDNDGAQYRALSGNDFIYLPDASTAGHPWDFNVTFDAGDGNDVVQGGTGNDLISGGAGNDYLFGGAGADRLVGAAGNDILAGGAGTDKLTGSDGKDIFVFTTTENGTTKLGAHDVITDFSQGNDKIDISALYSTHAMGSFTAGSSASAGALTGYNVIYFSEGGKTYIAGDTDGIAGADFFIELSGAFKLKGTDLLTSSSVMSSEAAWSSATAPLSLNYNQFHHDNFFI